MCCRVFRPQAGKVRSSHFQHVFERLPKLGSVPRIDRRWCRRRTDLMRSVRALGLPVRIREAKDPDERISAKSRSMPASSPAAPARAYVAHPETIMAPSFIESGFTTRKEYEAWVASGASGVDISDGSKGSVIIRGMSVSGNGERQRLRAFELRENAAG